MLRYNFLPLPRIVESDVFQENWRKITFIKTKLGTVFPRVAERDAWCPAQII